MSIPGRGTSIGVKALSLLPGDPGMPTDRDRGKYRYDGIVN